MLLGAIILKNVQNVNSFQRTTQTTIRQGSPTVIYFQLVDLDQLDASSQPLRYVPSSGSTMTATINSINTANVVSRLSTNPYGSDDRSIWSMSILSTDKPASGNLDIKLTEGSVVRTTTIANGVIIWSSATSQC